MTIHNFDSVTLDRLTRIYSSRKNRSAKYILEAGDEEFIDSCIPKSASIISKKTINEKLTWIKKKLPDFLVEQQKLKDSGGAECLLCGFMANTLFTHIINTHKIKVSDYKKQFGDDVVIASKEYLKFLSDKVKGSNNPAYQHGGRLSPYSKKFVKYQDLNEDELDRAILSIKDKNYIGRTPDKRQTNIEYYLAKGMSVEDATKALSERQSTFSLDKCVDKYGILEGTFVWQDRQDKWQDSLKEKSQEEIDLMNAMKSMSLNAFILRYGNDTGLIEYIKYCNSKDWKYFTTITDLNEFLCELFDVSGYIDKSISRVPEYQFGVLGIVDSLEYCKSLFTDKWGTFPSGLRKYGNTRSYYYDELDSYGDHIVLRSSIEKKMHSMFVENNINFIYEKQYPNSTLRYDFYLPDFNKYIEICGFMNDPVYVSKMHFKQETFGAILVISQSDMKKLVAECKVLTTKI